MKTRYKILILFGISIIMRLGSVSTYIIAAVVVLGIAILFYSKYKGNFSELISKILGDEKMLNNEDANSFDSFDNINDIYSTPNEIKTFSREIKEKIGGIGEIICGYGSMVGSFIMYIAAIEKSDNLIVPAIPALMLFIFGAYLVFIGRKRIQKARYISWTIEALEKYDRIKRKLREK